MSGIMFDNRKVSTLDIGFVATGYRVAPTHNSIMLEGVTCDEATNDSTLSVRTSTCIELALNCQRISFAPLNLG
jgi:hypothetical protein